MNMGRQTQIHLLEEDCKRFLDFVHGHDPVAVVHRDSKTPDIERVENAWEHGDTYCLWNQALLPDLERKHVTGNKPYYRVDSALVIEFSYPQPAQETWNGRPALTQGRVWAGFEQENKKFEAWYNAVVRWIRKEFVRNPLPLDGYVGPAAFEWYRNGGILLPMVRPPVTAQWLSWVEAQDQHRTLFGS